MSGASPSGLRRIMTGVLKWAFLIVFLAAMIYGFMMVQAFDPSLLNLGTPARSLLP